MRSAVAVAVTASALLLTASLAGAQPAPDPTHEAQELANCIAQRKCPTPTPTLTPTLRPTPVPTPQPAAPTPTATPTATLSPEAPLERPLPVPDADAGPQVVYLLPNTAEPELDVLASVFGRWAIRQGDDCEHLPLAVNLLLDPLPADGVPQIEQPGTDPVARCQIVEAHYLSEVPCAQDDSGACDAALDPIAQLELAGDIEPPPPQVVLVPAPQQARPAPARAPPPAPAAPVPPKPQPPVEIVVTATPTPAAETPTPMPPLGPPPTATRTPEIWRATWRPSTPTPAPTPQSRPLQFGFRWPETISPFLLAVAAAVPIMAIGAWMIIRRLE